MNCVSRILVCLLAGGGDGFIIIYDVFRPIGKERYTFPSVGTIALNNRHRHKFSVETVLWYPLDTGLFTSSGTDCLLKVWDTNRLKPADEYQFSGLVNSHHMSPIATKHCLIAVATNSSTVKLVDLKSGSSTHSLKGHDTSVFVVKWSPHNEFTLATGGGDGKIMLWDIRNAKGSLIQFDKYNGTPPQENFEHSSCIAHNIAVNGLQFSADGLYLVSCGNDNALHLWDTTTGRNVGVNYISVSNRSKKSLQFAVSSACNRDLVFMPNDTKRNPCIHALDMMSGKNLYTLTGHYSSMNCCLFHPDFHELYSAGMDRNILVWTPKLDDTGYSSLTRKIKRAIRKTTSASECKIDRKVSENGAMKFNGAEVKDLLSPVAVNPLTADSWSSDEDG
ncbi:DNA excision repair protein ERCC-8-like isoform X2 [Dreissena polymorpha]|uniref:DNA excision repair protein ERCC-8-like isoform X2 n=1 Tax=Dreissena polymorpha TaxID=45954 RepID=UPI0022642363|nr:DNA excision repair protein ERCC-8-like isoform X2 [Dreissena polymorpha]